MKDPRREIIYWGKLLFERRLVAGWGGNLSCRLGKDRFLITAQHSPLGFLTARDLVRINGRGDPLKKGQRPSSETPLHLAIYRATDTGAIVHAHPPMVMAFSLACERFVPTSFEEKYTIGEVPVIPQETPTVVNPEKVVAELKLHPVVILQGHGTVAAGKDLKEAFLLTDLLEEAIRCQSFAGKSGSDPASGREEPSAGKGEVHALFSAEHMNTLVESANNDPEFRSQGEKTQLTTSVTFCLEDGRAPWTVHFERGRISRLESGGEGEFVISGKREWWEAIFRRKLDPFVATHQGRIKLKRGELWKLAQWFKPFKRAFDLWQTIPVK